MLMEMFERHVMIVAVFGVVSLLVLLVLTIFGVNPNTRARVVAQAQKVLFGIMVLAIVGFGLYFS